MGGGLRGHLPGQSSITMRMETVVVQNAPNTEEPRRSLPLRKPER